MSDAPKGLRWTGESTENNTNSGRTQATSSGTSISLAQPKDDIFAAELHHENSTDSMGGIFKKIIGKTMAKIPAMRGSTARRRASEVKSLDSQDGPAYSSQAISQYDTIPEIIAVKCEDPMADNDSNDWDSLHNEGRPSVAFNDSSFSFTGSNIDDSRCVSVRNSCDSGIFPRSKQVMKSALASSGKRKSSHLSEVMNNNNNEGKEDGDEKAKESISAIDTASNNTKKVTVVDKAAENASQTVAPPGPQSQGKVDPPLDSDTTLTRQNLNRRKSNVDKMIQLARERTMLGKYNHRGSTSSLDYDSDKKNLESSKFAEVGFHPISAFSVKWDFFMSSTCRLCLK
jgi:hypothetical protein